MYYFFASPSLSVGDGVPALVWQLPWQKRNSAYEGRVEEVIAWSHSVFNNAEVLREARGVIASLRKKTIAEIELTSSDGHARDSQSDIGEVHYDWWCVTEDHDHGGCVVDERMTDAA